MSNTSGLKQVIVMRTDLNMRKGKMIAQGSHASGMVLISFFVSIFNTAGDNDVSYSKSIQNVIQNTKNLYLWLTKGMTKITVRADSEAELLDIYEKAQAANLTVYLITDAGHTEFGGVPTKTCLCIGPNDIAQIDAITGELKLL